MTYELRVYRVVQGRMAALLTAREVVENEGTARLFLSSARLVGKPEVGTWTSC